MRYNPGTTYADVMCPYFATETEKSLNCEGAVKGTKRTQMIFNSQGEKVAYITKHCCQYPTGCPLAEIIERKYE